MRKTWLLVIFIFLGLYSVSFADELVLTNGDVITGEIIALDTITVVIDSPTLGRLSIERNRVNRGVFYGVQPEALSEPIDAPTDAVILTDWKDAVKNNRCKEYVKFTGIKIKKKQAKGDRVEVFLEVKGNWFGGRFDFLGGPCFGFLYVRGKDQIVDKKMVYRKFNDRWMLELLR